MEFCRSCTNRMEMFRSLQSPPSSRTVNVLLSESLSAVSDKVTYWAVGSKAKNTTREQPRDLWPLRYLIRLTTSPTHQTGQTHPSQVPQLTWSSGWGTWLNSPNSPNSLNWPSSPQLTPTHQTNSTSSANSPQIIQLTQNTNLAFSQNTYFVRRQE